MSVPNKPPLLPIALTELTARARQEHGSNAEYKLYAALHTHADTAQWLDAMKPFAFVKGAVVRAVPAARDHWQNKARDVTIRAVFAHAKTVRGAQIHVPGRGKVKLSASDMLDPAVQYRLSDGDLDLSALAALQSVAGLNYTLDAERLQRDAEYAEAQKDWAHGDHPLQSLDLDLKAVGIFADTPEDAALQLQGRDDQPELLAAVLALSAERDHTGAARDYGTFTLPAWRTPDPAKRRTVAPKALPGVVRQALSRATFITGNWDALSIPRACKAEAFDRMVQLFTALLTRITPEVVAANTDDLIGKAAVMAAADLKIKTVGVQLAGWDFKPARMQYPFCEKLPTGGDVELARHDQHVQLAELVRRAVTLGQDDLSEHLTACCQRLGKSVRSLDATWATHHGLK